MYQILDIFFILFHTIFTLFNLLGWIWKKTRHLNIITLGLTTLSWFGLGLFYGMGYCFCTDWHWQVRAHLGDKDMPHSYIKFLIDEISGSDISASLVDNCTMIFFIVAVVASISFNLRDWKCTKNKRHLL